MLETLLYTLSSFVTAISVLDAGRLIDSDLDAQGRPRRLWQAGRRATRAVVSLEVVNSTPEPDGSHRHYFLRVPPDTLTCRAAVAWTFALGAEEYSPVFES